MAITIKSKIIKEDLLDENGVKLGELTFNPNDTRIVNKMSKIIDELGNALTDLKRLGEFPEIPETTINSIEDFEKIASDLKRMNTGINVEMNAVSKVINDLIEVFGEETVNIFTEGTMDLLSVLPLIEFVAPHVRKARNEKVDAYMSKRNNGVME